ncbi:MAG: hypothetical protein HND51_12070 [Chloroflexi bacterium]|nr:hypothetical protein [Chloroflexota bacterium]
MEKPGSEERLSFSSISDLLTFIKNQTDHAPFLTHHRAVEKKEKEDITIEITITIKPPGGS